MLNTFITNSAPRDAPDQQSTGSGRICIVTGELAGPDFNGGIGTTNRALAIFLKARGCRVDVLYTRVADGKPFSARGSFAEHVNAYGELDIRLDCIDHSGPWNDWQAKSFQALRQQWPHQLRHQLFQMQSPFLLQAKQ